MLWPVAISRSAGTVVAIGIALATRTRPRFGRGGITGIALISGAIDAAANVCYVLATRAGQFGLAVVITSLYPGITVCWPGCCSVSGCAACSRRACCSPQPEWYS